MSHVFVGDESFSKVCISYQDTVYVISLQLSFRQLHSPTSGIQAIGKGLSEGSFRNSHLSMASIPQISAAARRLQGKVALITGGASGIGESTARLFSRHGAKVVIADIQDNLGQSVCKELSSPTSASFVHCDVTSEKDVENAINVAVAKYGKLDIMFNNAGIVGESKPNILDNDKTEFEKILNVNVVGAFLGTKHAARVMIPAGNGSIITTASVCSTVGGVASHAYTSSKHAVVGLARNAAVELGKYGIRVNCVSPYLVVTPLAKDFFKLDDDGASGVYSNLKGKVLNPEDVAEAALYLASEESKYVSGHNLLIDGGFTIVNPAFGIF
ncbi:borneol dehydrogenase, mitochondrial-like [Vitis vinifera]|uniref:Secoisolariciresinol dehydrogenase n=3 Tax=Vitis TaxID=3603 RepID=A0A438HQD0_VITVI|nr:borneol dehydrogenase, mitochondrial-like [Vitis vinifera]RVW86649.1 Secoisolariciresinol dehydrogenase [Vitis vinifera]|eukprot:XP_002272206.2 PREDICTED: secoisolariciresinol dehydrogenase-like [Vitis vinifera]